MARMNFDLDPTLVTPESVAEDRRRLRFAFLWTGSFVALLWLVLLLQVALGIDPGHFGVVPREPAGLLGVLTAPLVHSGFGHLFANTSAVLVLGVLALRLYPRAIRWALPVIWLGSGLLVWWLARPSSHIGASGIAQGLMFFIFAMGLLRRERLAIIASMVVFFLYGSMVYGVLPQDPRISWEYHLFGSLCGLLSAFFLYRLDAMPPRRSYSWEQAGEDDDRSGNQDETPFSVLQQRAERAALDAAEQDMEADRG
ncbi:MAG: rhomboid family intramembrane serine protease [Rhodanobacteraceae bacterium]